MTTMAVTAPPLLRLFSRLDLALENPRSPLGGLLEAWGALRGRAIAPGADAAAAAIARGDMASAFLFEAVGRDYQLKEGAASAEPLLGTRGPERLLSKYPGRRNAARLRRLLDEARRLEAPLIAQFVARMASGERGMVEILAAPLATSGGGLDAVLAAASITPLQRARIRTEKTERDFAFFALAGSRDLAARISRALGTDVWAHEERVFGDGEFKIRPLVNVRNRDVFVLSSLNGDETATSADKLCRMLFFIAALKDAGASRVTAVAPYLCFQRKDRQTKPRDPVTSRYTAQLFEAMGADGVVTVDVHNLAAFQNAFRCDTDHLDAHAIFADHVVKQLGEKKPVAVVSPDLGGEKRAELFRERLERMLGRAVGKAFMDKHRSEGKVVGDIFAGDVTGRTALVIDDLISGGGTMARVAHACRRHGSADVWCFATHGVFSPEAAAILLAAPIDKLVVTDTVPLPRHAEALKPRLLVLSAAGLLAEAIRRRHNGGSIVSLLDAGP